MKFERLRLSDREELLSFLNESYRRPGHDPDFLGDLPKAFQPTEECMHNHLALRDEKGLAVAIGIYPMTLVAGRHRVTVTTVGNLATRRDLRGQGLMERIMTESVRLCDEEGYQMERLGGLRSRYNRFGFERAGTAYRFAFTARNAGTVRAKGAPALTLVPMKEGDPLVTTAFEAYRAEAFGVDRIDPATFFRVVTAHFMRPFAALDETGAFRGYVTVKEGGETVNEIFAPRPEDAPAIAAAVLDAFSRAETEIYCTEWCRAVTPLTLASESYRLFTPSLFRLHDPTGVPAALLALKNERSPLPDAAFTYSVEGEAFRLGIEGGEAFCEKTAAAPEIELDSLSALRFLFGPLSPSVTLGRPVPAAASALLPLPLSWDRQDNL